MPAPSLEKKRMRSMYRYKDIQPKLFNQAYKSYPEFLAGNFKNTWHYCSRFFPQKFAE